MGGTITDLVLVAILLIALIVGAIRGFMRQLTGLISGIFSIVLAVIFASLLLNAIRGTSMFSNFCATTSGWFNGSMFTTEVYSQEELASVMSDSGGWSVLSALAPTFFTEMAAFNYMTFGQLLGYYVATAIGYVVLWLVTFILLKIIIKAIGKLLQKVASLPILKTIDRILGAILSIGLVYLALITILLTGIEVFVYKFINGSWDSLCSFIQQSKILTFANNTNYLGMILAQHVQVVLPTL